MSILKRPIVTEKMSALNEAGRYGFVVDINANKLTIKEAVEKLYKVTVKKVNTINVMGKAKSRQTKDGLTKGRRPNYKKAIVTLNEGDIIDFYQNV